MLNRARDIEFKPEVAFCPIKLRQANGLAQGRGRVHRGDGVALGGFRVLIFGKGSGFALARLGDGGANTLELDGHAFRLGRCNRRLGGGVFRGSLLRGVLLRRSIPERACSDRAGWDPACAQLFIRGTADGDIARTKRGGRERIRTLHRARKRILRALGPQHDAIAIGIDLRLDTAMDFAFRDPVQHFCVRRGGLGTEIPIIRRQIAEILRNRLHRRERLVEPFQRAGKCPVRHGENITSTNHGTLSFF